VIEIEGKAGESAGIVVLGLGYVGCVTAACLAELGNRVIGVDLDEYKVRTVMAGHAPFFEPGLEEIISSNVGIGRLTATTNILEALPHAEFCFICVGTPSAQNNDVVLDYLKRVCCRIAATLAERTTPLTVIIRSTIFPGSCEEVVYKILPPVTSLRVVVNPEFLREGSAVADFMEPSLIVVGSDDPQALDSVAGLYAPLRTQVCRVSLRAAEMIKYACNAFHAVKIAFSNEMGALSERLGISAAEVMNTVCEDRKLNIATAYLRPGFAFGGSCLPKDLRALSYRASRLDVKLPLLDSVLGSNEEHLRRAVETVDLLPARRIGIYGLAFKENTDDLRESPVLLLLQELAQREKEVKVFDPHIQLERIYGSNRNFALSKIPDLDKLLQRNLQELLTWADYVVLTQRPSAEDAAAIMQSGTPALDLGGEGGSVTIDFSGKPGTCPPLYQRDKGISPGLQ
jgi:GDP-mannose 6-dehydrogenase